MVNIKRTTLLLFVAYTALVAVTFARRPSLFSPVWTVILDGSTLPTWRVFSNHVFSYPLRSVFCGTKMTPSGFGSKLPRFSFYWLSAISTFCIDLGSPKVRVFLSSKILRSPFCKAVFVAEKVFVSICPGFVSGDILSTIGAWLRNHIGSVAKAGMVFPNISFGHKLPLAFRIAKLFFVSLHPIRMAINHFPAICATHFDFLFIGGIVFPRNEFRHPRPLAFRAAEMFLVLFHLPVSALNFFPAICTVGYLPFSSGKVSTFAAAVMMLSVFDFRRAPMKSIAAIFTRQLRHYVHRINSVSPLACVCRDSCHRVRHFANQRAYAGKYQLKRQNAELCDTLIIPGLEIIS